MKLLRFFVPISICVAVSAHAQVVFTGIYTQNFNSLATTGTTATWTNNTTLPGWYAGVRGSGATYGPATGYVVRSLTAGQNVGASAGLQDTALVGGSSADRSLGLQPSGTTNAPSAGLPLAIGLRLTNSTNAAIGGITLTFTGEQWSQGYYTASIFESLSFSYSTDATGINTGTYLNVPEVTFTAPLGTQTTNATTTFALDGNSAANRVQFTAVNISIDGGWAAGTDLWLRWTPTSDLLSDQRASILSIDDLNIGIGTVAAIPEPSTWALLGSGLALVAFCNFRARRKRT